MSSLHQHSVVHSLEEALIPKANLIDSRTEEDRLSFLANFASLINFYDGHNNPYYDWVPVLLKDPLFLLASMAKTKLAKQHRENLNYITRNRKNDTDTEKSINQLFNQFIEAFLKLGEWTHYMKQTDQEYNLKKYVLHEVKKNFSADLWALLELRQQLFLSATIEEIKPLKSSLFKSYDEKIWKQSREKKTYLEVLNLKHKLTDNSTTAILDALLLLGDKLYTFMDQIIAYAFEEFERTKTKKSEFPDTILLRTFINLLKVQQLQLNTISEKHLKFYYQDILKQKECLAISDSVFICTELAKNDAIFELPQGILFDAGTGPTKKPILFETIHQVHLNPAKIIGAYTLSQKKEPAGKNCRLHLQNIPKPGVLKKDEDGQVKKWSTFGSDNTTPKTTQDLGFAFATPMLFLKEGKRTITLQFNFATKIAPKILKEATFYLSTKETWLQVEAVISPPVSATSKSVNQISLVISLDESKPPIEAFQKNPDGVTSSWPMAKILCDKFQNLSTPIVLKSISVAVTVLKLKNFKLYNDKGALSQKNPFPLFGQSPSINSNFIIGSEEIFSKPISFFNIQLNWGSLPKNFQNHYQEYNNYLDHQYEGGSNNASFLKKALDFAEKLIHINIKPKQKKRAIGPFNNLYFKVGFKRLQEKSWEDLDMIKVLLCEGMDGKIISTPYTINPQFLPERTSTSDLLFTIEGRKFELSKPNKSYFAYTSEECKSEECKSEECKSEECKWIPNVSLQRTPLKYTDDSENGFIRMSLTSPSETIVKENEAEKNSFGFGRNLYPKVVSAVSLANALGIAKSYNKPSPKLLPPPNLPFTPKVQLFLANYTASQKYEFDAKKDNYPIQYFHYGPFKNYMVYDNDFDSLDTCTSVKNPLENSDPVTCKPLPLFPTIAFGSALFLELENVIAPGELNFYFELAQTYNDDPRDNGKVIEYRYLSVDGWKKLPVLSDGTNNFSCSGILSVNIPEDISNIHPTMPKNNYWIQIGVHTNPNSFAKTVFLKSNGFELKRSGVDYLTDTQVPKINSNSVTSPHTPIPEISSLIQPFPSFGGKGAEDMEMMNKRVSIRLKSKDRATNTDDFFKLIRQQFGQIYYTKVFYDTIIKATRVLAVKKVENVDETNAFTPLISTCEQEHIADFLKTRTSAFANIKVANFQLLPINIKAKVSLEPSISKEGANKKIIQKLNIFLSPWIVSDEKQITIDTEISTVQISSLIAGIEGVLSVEKVSIELANHDDKNTVAPALSSKLFPISKDVLLVPSAKHNIKYRLAL